MFASSPTPDPIPSGITPYDVASALAAFRDDPPLVQCLTNIVVAQWSANVLLAAGASPAMVDNPHEAQAFAGAADAVLVNLGTPYDDTVAAMSAAVRGAAESGRPWVLDPIAAGALPWRTAAAHDLVAIEPPAVIRGNASEILGLAGGAGGRGADSIAAAESTVSVAAELAGRIRTVVAVSGETDHLTDGTRLVRVGNGHPWLTRVTGVGCALGALMAGFCAVVEDRLLAAAAATAMLTVAAEVAALTPTSRGPGSFAVALLDEISLVSPDVLAAEVRLS